MATKPIQYKAQSSMRKSRANEFDIIDRFKYGYRHREDQTNLPKGVLVEGSKNILTNVSERIQCRKGYILDGPTSAVTVPISSAYTFESNLGFERNVRAYLPSAGAGTMEYRYVNDAGTVTWRTLLSSLNSANFNFTPWWDVNELLRELLMVNGSDQIYEWGGGVAVATSSTATTVTKTGTTTWAEAGFYADNTSHATRKITINGTDFTYTGGETTTTLTGLSADPAVAIAADPIVHQTPIVTTNGSMMAMDLTENDLIQSFQQQLWVGSLKDQTVYVSNFQDYKDYTVSSINASGFGKQFALDSPPVSFIALENAFTISAGFNQWYQMTLTQGTYTDTTNPAAPVVYAIDTWTIDRLKTNSSAAAQSQALTGAMKNDVIFVSQEPTLDRLGRVEQILGTTQTTNISDPIKLDFDSYDFTDGQIYYNKYFIYLSVPKMGLVRIYNIVKNYWEAPQTIPVGKFYTVGGVLYGHSYQTAESYLLFSGRGDRISPANPTGNPINATVLFSYQNYNSPFSLKNFNKFYVEGYISTDTTIDLGISYDIDGCATDTSYEIDGSSTQYVCSNISGGNSNDASLGKQPLGKYPLGGDIDVTGSNTIPPKFRLIQTFPSVDFHEVQYSFSTSQVGANWEILRFGPAVDSSSNLPTSITN